MLIGRSYSIDSVTGGWVPAIPLPFYCWQIWKWQKVRCTCGKTFISRSLGLMPPEYETHYALNHVQSGEENDEGTSRS